LIALFISSATGADGISTRETIKREGNESEADFQKRKDRITFGTAENRRYCHEVIRTNVGLCNGGSEPSCMYKDLYRAWCVRPGEDADALMAKVPPLSRNDFFDYRNGEWWSRARYCAWYAEQRVRERNLQRARENFQKNCGDLYEIRTR